MTEPGAVDPWVIAVAVSIGFVALCLIAAATREAAAGGRNIASRGDWLIACAVILAAILLAASA